MAPTQTNKIVLTLLLAGASFCPNALFALGIRIADQDATATARGNAFAATADNPSAIYYNPAGIAQLDGFNASVGTYGIFLNSHFKNGAASFDTEDKLQAIPQIFFTAKIPDQPIAFGLGIYSPYGLSLEWPSAAPFSGITQKGQIEYLTLNPVIAFKPYSTLSIAMGATINYAEADLRAVPGGAVGSSLGNDFRFRGRDEDVGFNAGILWQPWEQHSFGVNYRSETDMNFAGHTDTRLVGPFSPFHQGIFSVQGESTTADFRFPRNIVFGYSFRPNKNWNIEFDADWTDWDNLNTVTLKKPTTGNQAFPFNWQSSWFYELGVTRSFDSGWSISGGYIYSENSVPDSTFNPIVPDSDRHIFSLGVGKKYKHVSWNAAYQFAWGPERTLNNSPNSFNNNPGLPGQNANGTYEFISHALTINFGYHF